MPRKIPQASEHMVGRARQLRQAATFPERLLWGRLRNHRCAGLKFRRQEAIGPYVADYYCASAQVIIELDGRSHDERAAEDEERQKYIERMGYRVIRFTNDSVLTNLAGVVEAIAAACTLTRPPSPGLRPTSPSEGEGLE